MGPQGGSYLPVLICDISETGIQIEFALKSGNFSARRNFLGAGGGLASQ